ncbi:hypothetical protein D3C73_1165460 [compost metagenome]
MRRNLSKEPVQSVLLGPLCFLTELRAHEDQLLARMRPLISKERPQVCQLLPAVTGHLAQHGSLAVNYFVVANGQQEVLREGVDQGERDGAVVPFAVDGVFGDVLERVVHPAHVPLETEAESAVVGGRRDTGECR